MKGNSGNPASTRTTRSIGGKRKGGGGGKEEGNSENPASTRSAGSIGKEEGEGEDRQEWDIRPLHERNMKRTKEEGEEEEKGKGR